MKSKKQMKRKKYKKRKSCTPESRLQMQERMQKVLEGYTTEKRIAAGKKRWANLPTSKKKKIVSKLRKGFKKYQKTVHPDAQAARNRRIADKAIERHANMTDAAKKAHFKLLSNLRKEWNKTRAGHQNFLYQHYIMKFIYAHRTPEETARINANRVGNITTKRGKFKLQRAKRRRRKFIEENVPRIKNFCGVVTEKEFVKSNGY